MFYTGVFCHYDHFTSGKKSAEPELRARKLSSVECGDGILVTRQCDLGSILAICGLNRPVSNCAATKEQSRGSGE